MTTLSGAADEIAALRHEMRRGFRIMGVVSMILALSLIFVLSFRTVEGQSDNRILRVRGIIIEDAAGHERILIGAPIPAAQNRVRTDDARVRESWAGRFPSAERYMNFYKDYRHTTNGIVILDEKGFDRIALGDPVPDPNIGKRRTPSTGMIINDEQGFERSGYGVHKLADGYSVGIGLDSNQGTEALTLAVFDGGKVGMSINNQQRRVYVGTAPPTDRITGEEQAFHGSFFVLPREANH